LGLTFKLGKNTYAAKNHPVFDGWTEGRVIQKGLGLCSGGGKNVVGLPLLSGGLQLGGYGATFINRLVRWVRKEYHLLGP
jgi:hypothetical protein